LAKFPYSKPSALDTEPNSPQSTTMAGLRAVCAKVLVLLGIQTVANMYGVSALSIHSTHLRSPLRRTSSTVRYFPGMPPSCTTTHATSILGVSGLSKTSLGSNLILNDAWYAGFVGTWIRECDTAKAAKNYMAFASLCSQSYRAIPVRNSSANAALYHIVFEGGNFSTHHTGYTFDDFYCRVNGWLGLPYQKLNNFSHWSTLSDGHCQDLLSQFPQFKNATYNQLVSMGDRVGMNEAQLQQHARGQGNAPSVKEARRHAAWKCALGVAGCDMANCAANFCQLEDGYIGHGAECASH